MTYETDTIIIPAEPDEFSSYADFVEYAELYVKHLQERKIFNEAIDKDPTIKIHVYPSVVHPSYETRTAWFRPGNAYTQMLFGILPMSARPPHEILEYERQLGINSESYLTSALLVDSPYSDESDFPVNVEKLVRSTFERPDDKITLIIHKDILWLDRAPERNAYGVE